MTTTSRVVLVLAGAFTALGGIFIGAEALGTPGGLAGAGLIGAWLVPLTVLTLTALQWPPAALPVLGVATGCVAAVSIAAAIAPSAWHGMENGIGPARAIVVFVLILPLATLGLHAARPAGVMLIVAGAAPLAAVAVSHPVGGTSLAAACLPAAMLGVIEIAGSR